MRRVRSRRSADRLWLWRISRFATGRLSLSRGCPSASGQARHSWCWAPTVRGRAVSPVPSPDWCAPPEGRVVFDGQEIGSWAAYRIRRAGLVHLPEGRGIFGDLTVIENLRMAAAILAGRQARRDGVERALEIFPKLADRRGQPARLLSGGEQQMLSLARAFVTSPKLVIADEMSLGLAPQIVDLVFDGLARAREAGVTVIMIEQYVHRALAFADECIVLQRGTLAWTGPAATAGGQLLRHYMGDVTAQ